MKRFDSGLLILLVVFAMILSACAAPKGPVAAPAPQKPGVAAPAALPAQLTREQQLIEGAKKEGSVVWWIFGGRAETMVKPFNEKYPFLQVKLWDTGGAEIMARLFEEAKAGRHSADVIFLSEKWVLSTPGWKEVFAEYEWPNTESWPYQRGHNYYRAIAVNPLGTTYNASLVTAAEAPKSWEDLKSTKWRGKAILSRSVSDVPLHFAYLWREEGKLNWDKSFSFWREVVSNVQPKAISGLPQEMHAAGESPLFLMNAIASAMQYKARGAPLEVASAPTAYAGANLLAVVKNAPHPNAARLLADYLASYEGQIILGNQTGLLVAHPEAVKKTRVNLELASRGIVKVEVVPSEFNTPENNSKSVTFWVGLLR